VRGEEDDIPLLLRRIAADNAKLQDLL